MLNWPGEFDDYLDFTATEDSFVDRSAGDLAEFVGRYWFPGQMWWTVATMTALAISIALWSRQRREVQLLLVGLGGVLLVETVLLSVYAIRGVDDLSHAYVGYFAVAGPVWVLVAGGISLVGATQSQRAVRTSRIGLAVVVLLVLSSASPANPYRGRPSIPIVADDLQAAAEVRIDFATPGWPAALGLIQELRRRDVAVCVRNPTWDFLVTDELICSTTPRTGALDVRVFGPGESPDGPVLHDDSAGTVVVLG